MLGTWTAELHLKSNLKITLEKLGYVTAYEQQLAFQTIDLMANPFIARSLIRMDIFVARQMMVLMHDITILRDVCCRVTQR